MSISTAACDATKHVLIPLQHQAKATIQHLGSLATGSQLYVSSFCHEHVTSESEAASAMTRGEVSAAGSVDIL